MTHWTDKRTARAVIGRAFERAGWKLFGWKPDRSDSMTDYFDPPDWEGIATWGRYVLVMFSGYNHKNASGQTASARGSGGYAGTGDRPEDKASEPELWPTLQPNEGRVLWHVESDGTVLAQGSKGVWKIGEANHWGEPNGDGAAGQLADELVRLVEKKAGMAPDKERQAEADQEDAAADINRRDVETAKEDQAAEVTFRLLPKDEQNAIAEAGFALSGQPKRKESKR